MPEDQNPKPPEGGDEDTTEVAFSPEVEGKVKTLVDEIVEEKVTAKLASIEGVTTKSIGDTEDDETPKPEGPEAVTLPASVKSAMAGETPVEVKRRFARHLKSFMAGDYAAVAKMNGENIEALVKAGYLNETTDADGGYLVPPAEFVAEVARLDAVYGVARRDARIRTVTGNTVEMPKKSSGLTMYETGEAVAKTGTKMQFGLDTVTLRKFAGIAPVTDELTADSAVDVWNELTLDFALETARIEDTLVFTDATTGLLNVAGTVAVSAGAAFDQLITAITSVPTKAIIGGKFYLSRLRLADFMKVKDSNGQYIWAPGPNGVDNGTLWGKPYEIVEVMPANKAIFGNLQFVTLIQKAGIELTRLTEGTVHGSDGTAINLAEQDMQALRGVIRRNAKVQFPAAFAVISGGTFVS